MFKQDLFAAVVLIVLVVVSGADGDLILTLNGVDLANGALEIKEVDKLVIGIGGDTEIEPNVCSVVATSGVLERVSGGQEYLFEFGEPAVLSVVRLIAERGMVIDGVEVCAEETIYYLVLFRDGERVVAFSADLEVLFAPQAEVQPLLESQAVDEAGEEAEAEAERLVFKPVEQEDKKVLLHCPWSAGSTGASVIGWGEFGGTGGVGEVAESMDFSSASGDESGGGRMMMGMDGVIDVNSDITSNTMWTAENTYHVLGAIDVNGALLVIEPGTVVTFAAGVNAGMRIVNGGTLISAGTPDEPVIYTSDAMFPQYGDYYCPIYIEESASVCTKVAYSYVDYAYAGIVVINKRLDTSIENNWLFSNAFGIVEYGTEHTDIRNNLIVGSYYSGIEVYLESQTNEADANSQILIENNTCDYYQDDGIYVHGTEDANDAGFVVLANNIVSGSYQFGLHLCDPCEWIVATVTNTGYYDNYYNKNWEFEEDDPVIESANPYREGAGWMPYWYVGQDCNFIDAGYGYVEDTGLIGKTTDVNSEPDSNYVDIGFHYPNWDFSNTGDGNSLRSDFNRDLIVNFADFAVLADGWQTSYDMNDLAGLAGDWLERLELGVRLNQEANSIGGVLSVELAWPSDEISYYMLMDGQRVGLFIGDDAEIPTYEYINGAHQLKVVGATLDGETLAAPPIGISVNNRLHCLTGSEAYRYNQAYALAGFYDPNGGSTIDFGIRDLNEDVIWSNSSGGDFNFVLGSGVLRSAYNELTIEEVGGERSGGESWTKDITKEFDVTSDPSCTNARSLLVGVKKGWTKDRKAVWKEYLNACREHMLGPTVCLFFGQSTRENIKTALSSSRVKAVMVIGDGNRYVGLFKKVHRTFFQACDGPYFSYLGRNWTDDPNDYEPLPDKYEERGYSIGDLQGSFWAREKMYVVIDACKNGTSVMDPIVYDICGSNPVNNDYTWDEYWTTGDMAHAFGIFPGTSDAKLYMGWRNFAFKDNPLTKYNSFLWDVWYQVGTRDKTFGAGISHAATYETGNCEPYVNFSWVGNVEIYFGN